MVNFQKNYFIAALLIIGLCLRLLLSTLPGFKIDTDSWFAWSLRLQETGLSKFYSDQVFTDYTPGYLYILNFLGTIKKWLNLDTQIYLFILKLPAIISEIIIGFLVFIILKKKVGINAGSLGALFVLLNLGLIFNSSIWGQIDSLLALLLLTAIYYLDKRKLTTSSIFFTLAFLVKPQAIALAPIYLIYIIKNFSFSNLLKIIIPGLTLTTILSLPFFPNQPLVSLINRILKTANEYPYTSLFAYNIWGWVGFWIQDNLKWQDLTYQTWGTILFGIYWIFLFVFALKKNVNLYLLSALALLAFYFLPTRVHERYLYPAIPFLIISAFYLKFNSLKIISAIFSFIYLANLYYVYIYYNEIYLKLPKVLMWLPLYNFLENNAKILSIFLTILFLLTTYLIIKYYYAKKT